MAEPLNPWAQVCVVVTVRIAGAGAWIFTSPPMDAVLSDILLRELAEGPFEVVSAHAEPAKEAK